MAEPNVLLLDEPTNDLDIDTLAALEDLLDAWPGTLVVVSHDRYLVERVCDTTVALLGDGSLAALPGGVDEYLARRRAGGAATPPSRRRRRRAQGRPAGPRPRAARKELIRLERRDRQAGAAGGAAARGAGRARHRPRADARAGHRGCGRSARRRTRPRRPGWSWRRPPELAEYGPCCPYGWKAASRCRCSV